MGPYRLLRKRAGCFYYEEPKLGNMIPSKLRAVLLSVAFIQLAVLPSLGNCEEEEKCNSCSEDVDEVLSTCTTIMESSKKDPMRMEKMDVCEIVVVSNLISLKRAGKPEETCSMPCTEKGKEKCFIQRIRIGFTDLNFTCYVASIPTLISIAYERSGLPPITIPSFKLPEIKMPWGWGSSSNDGTTTTAAPDLLEIHAKWPKLEIVLEMLMCYEVETYEVRKLELQETAGMECWCDGTNPLALVGKWATKLSPIRKALGFVGNVVIKMAMPLIMKLLPEKLISMLNCGDKR